MLRARELPAFLDQVERRPQPAVKVLAASASIGTGLLSNLNRLVRTENDRCFSWAVAPLGTTSLSLRACLPHTYLGRMGEPAP
jgi:hypothetical protein